MFSTLPTEKNSSEYFLHTGFRQLALEMLIESARTIVNEPHSEASAFQYRWLLGHNELSAAGLVIDKQIAFDSTFCFCSLAGDDDISTQLAAEKFIHALETDASAMIAALLKSRTHLAQGTFDFANLPEMATFDVGEDESDVYEAPQRVLA